MIEALLATRSRWPLATRAAILGALTICAAGALLAVSGYLISRAAQQPQILTLGVAIVGVRFLGISRSLLRYYERLTSHDVAFRSLTDLRLRFFRRLVPLVPAGLPGVSNADLLSRFVADADRMQDLYLRAVLPVATAILAGAIAVLAAGLILPAAGAAMIAVLIAGAIVAPLLVRTVARRSGTRQASARASATAEMTTLVQAAPEIAVAGREEDWERRTADTGGRLARLMRRDAVASGLAAGLAEAVAAGAAVVMALVAIPAIGDGEIAGVVLAALVLLALASAEIFTPLGAAATSVDAVSDAAARLDAITSRPDPVPEPASPRPLPAAGPLRMSGVDFSYPGESEAILNHAELTVSPGEAVALVGRSGTGKSTIADLLTRFRDPDRGTVEFGGTDVRGLDSDELRKAVRLAPQDAHLFATSIRANLALAAPEAGDDELTEALRATGLGPWLDALPDGLDTHVGEAGAQVSGGQRQRIAAARLLASDARFLIFDEPTGHLDAENAKKVVAAAIAAARDGRGVVVITHDESLLGGFDRVVGIHDGRLTSGGTRAVERRQP